jgi:hypothetical protein
MAKLNAEQKMKFQAYVDDAKQSAEVLGFLLDNLGERIDLNYSVESLVRAEAVFWRCVETGLPPELSDLDHFAHLLGQYMGQSLVRLCGAKWVQSQDQNPMFAQPSIDGFGGMPWDRVYPVEISLHIRELPQTKPSFPGLQDRRVFARRMEDALRVYRRAQQLGGQN